MLLGNERLLFCVTENNHPYGSWPVSNKKRRGNKADMNLKHSGLFLRAVWCHIRGYQFCSYISSAKKTAYYRRGDMKVRKVFHSYFDFIKNFRRDFFQTFLSLLWLKISSPLPSWQLCPGSLTLTLQALSQSTKVHKDKILTILRTIGSLRT